MGCHCLLRSCFSCVQFFASLWTAACQTPPFVEFSRQEYWSGLPCFLQGVFWPRDWTCLSYVSCIGRWVLHHCKTQWFIVSTFNFLPSSDVVLLLLSRFSHVQLCVTPKTTAHQTPPSLGFSRQEHEWVAISFSSAWKWKVKVKFLSPIWLLATPWTAAYQAPPPIGFSRQEYYFTHNMRTL